MSFGAKRNVKFAGNKIKVQKNWPLINCPPNNGQKSNERISPTTLNVPRLDEASSGLVISPHKAWPDLQLSQSQLFFECTLFLYSVLALFLQYLNLYKTLWWLPKSHWHYSMKYHLINPYLLSCIGLLLGLRVTKCFWDTISERINFFSKDKEDWSLIGWKVFEYAIIKTPLVTIVSSSFLFSFTRIFLEFGVKSIFYFVYPFCVYVAFFQRPLLAQLRKLSLELLHAIFEMFYSKHKEGEESAWDTFCNSLEQLGSHSQLVDLDNVVHLCSDVAARVREEARILIADFELRCKYCVYAGMFTAYFSILMPRMFVPVRTNSGEHQYMFIDDIWLVQKLLIVFLTAFSLYVTYLFPINYFDMLYRCAVHLGRWEKVHPNRHRTVIDDRIVKMIRESTEWGTHFVTEYQDENPPTYNSNWVLHNREFYEAKSHEDYQTVAAEPGNADQLRLYRIAKNPVVLMTYICIFQGFLVAVQFWMLLMTRDWQHIVTLVLLMFANYLLLAKMFKDRVVIGRVYSPSSEDLQLIRQLQEESHQQQNNHQT